MRSAMLHLIFLALVVVWWYTVKLCFSISDVILPAPHGVIGVIGNDAMLLLKHAGITAFEAAAGLAVGATCAFLLAVWMALSPIAGALIYPYSIAFKAIPLVALAPLVAIWAGTGVISKVILAAVISFFPVLVSAYHGMTAVSRESLDLMTTLSSTRWQTLWMLRFPASLPELFQGLKVSATFSVIGAVVAEFIAAQAGIGYIVKRSSYFLDTATTFAGIIVASGLGLLFFYAISRLERWVVFWPSGGQH